MQCCSAMGVGAGLCLRRRRNWGSFHWGLKIMDAGRDEGTEGSCGTSSFVRKGGRVSTTEGSLRATFVPLPQTGVSLSAPCSSSQKELKQSRVKEAAPPF